MGHHTFSALSWVLGFLLPMRLLRERMASLGATVLDLITSEISRFRAISSLSEPSQPCMELGRRVLVALQAAARCLLDLLVQGRVGRGRPPAHHLKGGGDDARRRFVLDRWKVPVYLKKTPAIWRVGTDDAECRRMDEVDADVGVWSGFQAVAYSRLSSTLPSLSHKAAMEELRSRQPPSG